ncbi:squalene monooxygenase-like [Amphiura filiformis]|uniref:squalene monooxygenase-like n=1 Tax=Amphiura filiformis TaxID=82378 RepID=UPI003B222A03
MTERSRCKFSSDDPEVVIIGAGITGASLAAVLGKNGRRVVVIERDMSPPNTFRGEALQPGGLKALQDMGLNEVIKDFEGMPYAGIIAFDYETGLKTKMTYSKDQGGMSTHHVLNPRSSNVQDPVYPEEPLVYHSQSPRPDNYVFTVLAAMLVLSKWSSMVTLIRAPLTVISDGTYSKFRKVSPNIKDSEKESYYIGIELRNVHRPDQSYPEVGIGSPLVQTVIYRLDDVTTRLLIIFQNKPPENIGQFLETEVTPNLPGYLQTPTREALNRQSNESYYKCIQGKRTPPSYDHLPGVLLLVDALETRDPITAKGDDEAFLKQKELFIKQRKSHSWTVNMTAHINITLAMERQSMPYYLIGLDFGHVRATSLTAI